MMKHGRDNFMKVFVILLTGIWLGLFGGCADRKSDTMVALGQETETKTVETVQQPSMEPDREGMIPVTFAVNNLLEVCYFGDPEKTQPFTKEGCYLYPKDYIYASIPMVRNEYSDRYFFEAFRIYEYNAEGRNVGFETIIPENEALVYEVPALERGHSISIVPVGNYRDRTLHIKDYVVTEQGEVTELNGTWTINNKEYYQEEVNISPLTSYVVSYKYNRDLYYFVAAAPLEECHYPRETGNADGEVIFKCQEPEEAVESFSVELHKYLSATIDNAKNGVISVVRKDTGECVEVTKKIELNRLKYGTVIEIKTDKEHKLNSAKYKLKEPAETTDGYLYTVVASEEKMKLEVLEWEEKTIDVTVEKNSAADWWDKILGKTKEERYVTLRCGETVYTYEELQKGKEVVLKEHDTLEVSVNRNLPEGYRVHVVINNQDIFAVERTSSNFSKVLGYEEVSTLRIMVQNTENEMMEKKVKLKVTLDKSLGSTMLFDISASGSCMVRQTGYLKGKETVFYDDVDAMQKIVIGAKNIQLYPDEAIKLEVRRDDGSREIRYCREAVLNELIAAETESGSSKEISVTISIAEVVKHVAYPGKNCHVQVVLADGDRNSLADGEVLEGSREVVVRIIPFAGYHMDTAFGHGRYMKDRIYERTMEYSKYVEKIGEILEKNPVTKEEN